MKYSISKFDLSARKALIKGAKEVYAAVATTLGPRGRNIVLWKPYQTQVQHDGVTVANAVNPKDPFQNAGATIIKEAARRQVETVGDGTSVAVIIGYAILSEAMRIIESGVNSMSLRKALEKGRDIIVNKIGELSIPIDTEKQKIQVATISSGDEQMGKMIGETFHKSGEDTAIVVEGSMGPETYMEHKEGMQIESGYKTWHFVTNPQDMTATISRARILVTDHNLDNVHDLVPLIKDAVNKGETNIVIIAEEISGTVLATMVRNKMEGKINFLGIKSPGFQKENILQDIATMVGANFIEKQSRPDLKKVTFDDLGYAEQVVSTKDATAIVDGAGEDKDIKDRVVAIKKQIEDEPKEFNREKLKERLAKMTGGIHVINVGGNTEIEVNERKERATDAVLATKVAMKSGIVPGGEVVFLSLLDSLEPSNEDEEYAYRILRKALLAPFVKLLKNAGLDAGEMRTKLVGARDGVDVTTGEVKDMVKEGIIDPTLVAQEAIKNGTSVAISIMTAYGTICEQEEEKK